MALHLLEIPEMRCTINLVPSLVTSLQAYTEHDASDRFLDVSRIPADSLSETDALFLLDHFFMANPDVVRPFPRYARAVPTAAAPARTPPAEALRRFDPPRRPRDLQVWFNLAWMHPLAVERDDTPAPAAPEGPHLHRGRQAWPLLDKHLEILRQVLPLHRQLAETGQVELTTTPYYHPILPLLFDKKLAREAMPDVKLPHTRRLSRDAAFPRPPRRRAAPGDSSARPPSGMWPAEGSVCQSMIPLLASHGVSWIATDEEMLAAPRTASSAATARGTSATPTACIGPTRSRGRRTS